MFKVLIKVILVQSLITTALGFVACGSNSNDDKQPTNPSEEPPESQIDTMVETFRAANAIPGLAIAVVSQPEAPVIWSKGYGVKSLETEAPVTKNTSFWLASVSKIVMGTAIAIAQEKGLIHLDDEVHTLLASGDFNLDNPGSEPVTFRQLVSHQSGIQDDRGIYQCSYYVDHGDGTHTKLVNLADVGISCPASSPVTLAGFLSAYLDAGGEFYNLERNFTDTAPGEQTKYSNIGAALAGYAIELASGQSLADYAGEEIFTPLNMSDTSWRLAELDSENVATPHFTINGQLTAIPKYELATWPDGGLRSSVSDLALFMATIMNKGELASSKVRILEMESVRQMLTPIAGDFGVFWFLDWGLQYNGEQHTLIGHNGADPGSFSYLFYDPIDNIGVVMVGNTDDDNIQKDDVVELMAMLFEQAKTLQ